MCTEWRAFAVLLVLLASCRSAPTSTASPPTGLTTTVQDLHPDQVVDGVPCLTSDLPIVHNHVHLMILADGRPITVPAGIGVGRPWGIDATGFITTGSCFAWLHTHDTTGLVHIVSSAERTFTLRNLFEVWGQGLGPNSALGYKGTVVVLVNGRRVEGDPRLVQLGNLQNIVLELGKPPSVPPPALYNFASPRA